MPSRDIAPIGEPCWIDLMTSDIDRARAFYGELFGWTWEDAGPDYGGYVNFSLDGARVAGCMTNQPELDAPDVWSVYLCVEDVQATLDLATANGGEVQVPPTPIPELGHMAVISDAGGASVGAWQPETFHGFGVIGEVGAPVHFELHTRAWDDSVVFYRAVFGWKPQVLGDDPTFRYVLQGADDGVQAGIMDDTAYLPEGSPAHWAIYFGVEDADKALDQIVALGGSVVEPAEDTPYGRLAVAADPTGAAFRLRGEVT